MGRQFLGGYIVPDGYQVYFRTDACASENEVMWIKGSHHMESLSPIYDHLVVILYPPTCLYCCPPSCLYHLARLLTSRVRSHELRKHPSVIKFNRPVVNSNACYNSNNNGTCAILRTALKRHHNRQPTDLSNFLNPCLINFPQPIPTKSQEIFFGN